jgi:hypothetical protein
MVDPNKQQLTTADLAGRRGNFADNPDLEAETPLNVRRDDLSAARPSAAPPFVVQGALQDATLRNYAPQDTPELRREWDTSGMTTSYANDMDKTSEPLFSDTDITDLRSRWSNVQGGFVDEPRRSVEQADQLVATVMQRLAEGFANERASLEKQWDSGDSVSTEDLRIALQRYRAFFGRLLNAA